MINFIDVSLVVNSLWVVSTSTHTRTQIAIKVSCQLTVKKCYDQLD